MQKGDIIMDGLRYLLREIEARRELLHDFQRRMDIANSKEFVLSSLYPDNGITSNVISECNLDNDIVDKAQGYIEHIQKKFQGVKDSKGFTLFSDGVPSFVRDESIYYKGTVEANQIITTVKDFNTLYKQQFNDLRQCSYLGIPLWPNETPPNNYEINEMLGYELGGGFCDAWLHMQIWSPSIQKADRTLFVCVEDRYMPKQRSSPKTESGLAITWENYPYNIYEQDIEEQVEIFKAILGNSLYESWKSHRKTTKSPELPIEILVNADTTTEQIWGQLLLQAFVQKYLNEAGQAEAYKELSKYYNPQVISRIIEHLLNHSFNPYDAKSNLAYMKSLSRSFQTIDNQEGEHFFYKNCERTDGDSCNALLKYTPNSVFGASLETGIPKRTIYQLIKDGEIQTDNSNPNIITLTDDAIEKLGKLSQKRTKRDDIYELAKLEGKSKHATKKWLQRHRGLPEDKFKEAFSKWLKLDKAG